MSRSEPRIEALPSRVAALVDRHQRLLTLEFAAVIDELQRIFPEACADPTFSRARECFASAPPNLLAAALKEPALEAWIGRAQALLGSPALRTCPQHHVPRILARLTSLVMQLAGRGGSPDRGRAIVLGGESIPLLGGAVQLRPPHARRMLVRWEWDQQLILRDAVGALLAEVPRDVSPPAVLDGTWRWERASVVEGVRVFSEPLCVQHHGAEARDGFTSAFERACGQLEPAVRACFTVATRAVGPACLLHPAEAASFVATSPSPAVAELANSLAAGLVHRCSSVFRFDTSSRLADSLDAGTEKHLTLVVADELAEGKASKASSMLRRMLDTCEKREPVQQRPLPVDPALSLDLRPAVARAGLSADDGAWCESKSHDLSTAPRWGVSDSLIRLTDLQLSRLRGVLSGWPQLEVREFGLACLDYHQGHFEDARVHLLACLEEDVRCEQYWLLLAFCLRHLRRLDLFEEVVFSGSRGASTLERMRLSL